MSLNIIKSNPELNNRFKRIRTRRRLAEALKDNNIDVETTSEKEEAEGSGKTEFEEQLGGLGIDVQTVGVSQSIQDASEMMDVAGVGAGQTAGEVAREMGKQGRSFADPFAEAMTSLGGREGLAAKAGLATYGSLLAGEMGLAKGLYTGTQMLSGPAGMALNIIGPTEPDPYGKPVAMGSGAFAKASSKVMDIHYNVADKMAQGIAGYNQGYLNGQLVSVSPGIFGGSVLSGNIPQGLTASSFSDLLEQAAEVEDEDAISGYAQGNPAAMMEAGITVDDYGSATEAAQAGIGYSSYDAQGNPTGAAPSGSQYSATGTFSSGNDNNDDNNDGGNGSGGSSSSSSSSDMGFSTAYGGKIGMQMGGDPAQQQQAPTGEMGFVGGPPDQYTEQQTIADDIPKTVPEGAFVINAPAVEFAGKEDVKQMLIQAYEIIAQSDIDSGLDKSPRATTIPSKEQVDIMISRGEVIVPPEVAKVIGYDRLEKINNRGKKEVARRQEESQKEEKPQAKTVAEGGFINMQAGGNTEEKFGVDVIEPMSPDFKKKVTDVINRGLTKRSTVEKLIDSLPDREALALTIFSESVVSEDSPEAMRAIGETVVNRMNDKTYSFKNLDTIKEVLKGRSRKGEGSKMFGYEGLEPSLLKDRLPEMLNNRYWQKALDAADMALETEPDFEQYKLRDDVFTYAKVGEASNRLKANKRNEYFTTIGQHDFYSRTPEKGGRISSETMGESPDFYR